MGAALTLDAGWLSLAALSPGAGGLAIALAALIGRTLSLSLLALSLAWPAGGATGRLRAALLLYGGLSLLGLPLTPGFAGRWAQLSLLGAGVWAAVAVAALAVAGWGLWRAGLAGAPAPANAVEASRGEQIAAVALLAVAGLLGLFPGLLLALATRLAG